MVLKFQTVWIGSFYSVFSFKFLDYKIYDTQERARMGNLIAK
jgi:hypothetical protein